MRACLCACHAPKERRMSSVAIILVSDADRLDCGVIKCGIRVVTGKLWILPGCVDKVGSTHMVSPTNEITPTHTQTNTDTHTHTPNKKHSHTLEQTQTLTQSYRRESTASSMLRRPRNYRYVCIRACVIVLVCLCVCLCVHSCVRCISVYERILVRK